MFEEDAPLYPNLSKERCVPTITNAVDNADSVATNQHAGGELVSSKSDGI